MEGSYGGCSIWELELQEAKLPDERFRANYVQMCQMLTDKPGHSFSAACGPSVRKSAHRLFSKEASLDLQYGHRQQTKKRCEGQDLVLIVEDTTDLNYDSHKQTQGLGNLGGYYGTKGLNMHSALVLSQRGEPFGLIGQHIWAPSASGRAQKNHKYRIEEKESYKWIRTKKWVNQYLEGHQGQILVIGDREADFYEHFAWPRISGVDLLVRAQHLKRNIYYEGQKTKLEQLVVDLPALGQMEVFIRRGRGTKARTAQLSMRLAHIDCPPATHKQGSNITLSLIHVKEISTAQVQQPVEWYLLTTRPVANLEEAIQIVGFYALRWIIERFHYVLKTGLRVERLQFDTFTRLKHALEVYSLVAWQLLWTAYIGKARPEQLALELFDPTEIEILQNCTGKEIITTTDYLLALGSLSGFVKSKAQPLPGEKLLWQSLKLLRAFKVGFQLAKGNSPPFYGTG